MRSNLYLKIYHDIPGYYILGYPKISYEIKLQCGWRSVPPLLAPPRAIHPHLVLLHDPPRPASSHPAHSWVLSTATPSAAASACSPSPSGSASSLSLSMSLSSSSSSCEYRMSIASFLASIASSSNSRRASLRDRLVKVLTSSLSGMNQQPKTPLWSSEFRLYLPWIACTPCPSLGGRVGHCPDQLPPTPQSCSTCRVQTAEWRREWGWLDSMRVGGRLT